MTTYLIRIGASDVKRLRRAMEHWLYAPPPSAERLRSDRERSSLTTLTAMLDPTLLHEEVEGGRKNINDFTEKLGA